MTSLKDYYKMLKAHDWFYYMSDDSGAYAKGRINYTQLLKLSHESAEHRRLLCAFNDHFNRVLQNETPVELPKEPAE